MIEAGHHKDELETFYQKESFGHTFRQKSTGVD